MTDAEKALIEAVLARTNYHPADHLYEVVEAVRAERRPKYPTENGVYLASSRGNPGLRRLVLVHAKKYSSVDVTGCLAGPFDNPHSPLGKDALCWDFARDEKGAFVRADFGGTK